MFCLITILYIYQIYVRYIYINTASTFMIDFDSLTQAGDLKSKYYIKNVSLFPLFSYVCYYFLLYPIM